jgi:hypothetical protein
LWHLASVDAPTVAVVWALGFARAAGVHLPAWVPILLALTVWPVYVGDRLLDARLTLGTAQIRRLHQRHYFHWRHRRVLAPLALAAAATAAAMVFLLMPVTSRERSSVLAAAAIAYFSSVHSSGVHSDRRLSQFMFRFLSPPLSKEFLVGVLFTAGCFLPTLSRAATGPGSPVWPLWSAAAFFAALAWLNCHAIDRWESAAGFPPSRVFATGGLLALAGLLLAAVLCFSQPCYAALVACGAASASLLALLDRLRNHLTPLALRTAADLVLLTPIALALR